MNLPEPGTKAWLKAMEKALKSPNFKIKVNEAACLKPAEPIKVKHHNKRTGAEWTENLVTKAQARDLNLAKQFLLNHYEKNKT